MKNLIYVVLAIAFIFTFSCTNKPKVNPETELQNLLQATNGLIEGITLKVDINRFMDFYDLKAELFYLDSDNSEPGLLMFRGVKLLQLRVWRPLFMKRLIL